MALIIRAEMRKLYLVTYKLIVIASLLLAWSGNMAMGQNLVPNESFEVFALCPSGTSQLGNAIGWVQPTQGTSDFLHFCAATTDAGVPNSFFGYQFPRTGDGMGGFAAYVPIPPPFADYREYIQIQLTSPLVAGTEYRLEFNLNIASLGNLATSNVGAHFSVGPVSNTAAFFLALTPQVSNDPFTYITDTLNWYCVDGTFVASGGEDHITIGNFVDDANILLIPNPNADPTAIAYCYFYIDDICLYPAVSPPCHAVLAQDGINLSVEDRGKTGVQLAWRSNDNTAISHFRVERSDRPSDFMEIKRVEAHSASDYSWIDMFPLQDNWYRVVQVNGDGREIPSQWVQLDVDRESPELFRAWIRDDQLNVVLAEMETNGHMIHLMDMQGRKVLELKNPERELRQPLEGLADGIYILEVIAPNGQRDSRKLVYNK